MNDRQRKRVATDRARIGSRTRPDTHITLGGMTFTGTDHVFRLGGERVEAFSGMHENLHGLLANTKLTEYEAELPSILQQWERNKDAAQRDWGAALHVDSAGSIFAIRPQPARNSQRAALA